MLLGDFFNIASTTNLNGQLIVTTEINPDHDIFKGHFPGQPVVPGVCLIQALKEIVEQNEYRKFRLQSATNIKFLAVIDPNINNLVQWEIQIGEDDHQLDVKCVAQWNQQVCFKFSGKYQ